MQINVLWKFFPLLRRDELTEIWYWTKALKADYYTQQILYIFGTRQVGPSLINE